MCSISSPTSKPRPKRNNLKILDLCKDHNIHFETEGHKHCRPRWVNLSCPFCSGNPGLHLGYNLEKNYFMCWRCGWHPVVTAIAALIKLDESKAALLIRQYNGHASSRKGTEIHPVVRPRTKSHRLPSSTGPLQRQHISYLQKRLFDPEKLEREWGLLGTGPVAMLDKSSYKNRIIIPIHWKGKQVSFHSRSISNKAIPKSKACPMDRELIHHKHIIYGKQELWRAVGVCVEGPADVWRLGPTAFCTFGIAFTQQQVMIISKIFKRVAVIFDDDPQAREQAQKLVAELRMMGLDALRIDIAGDPAAMEQDEANYLVKHITGKGE